MGSSGTVPKTSPETLNASTASGPAAPRALHVTHTGVPPSGRATQAEVCAMRKVPRILVHAEQHRLRQLRRHHQADRECWRRRRPPLLSLTGERLAAWTDACTPTATPGHHAAHSAARLTPVNALRCAPTPLRGAHGLDRGSAEPRSGTCAMALDCDRRTPMSDAMSGCHLPRYPGNGPEPSTSRSSVRPDAVAFRSGGALPWRR